MLKKSRIVKSCGETCHVYLPMEMIGKEIVGVIIKSDNEK